MNIEIYQINLDRDSKDICFRGLEDLERILGTDQPDSGLYDKVFKGEVDCESLEGVYRTFNLDHPAGYRARSLSVSDVVRVEEANQVKPGFYFCDSIGFSEVEFEPERTQMSRYYSESQPQNTISVLLIRPNQYPKMVEMENSLEAMQKMVGGYIEEYMPFEGDDVAIICNEEGKLTGLPLNRAIYTEPEEVDMSYQEMKEKFREAERSGQHITGCVVFTEDSFKEKYPLESRTYLISSNNKAFQPNQGGYSIYAGSLDGSDPIVRLENYMAVERGGEQGWKIERCYMKDDRDRQMTDIICGDFFMVRATPENENFQSLPKDMAQKYAEKFKYPERFVQHGQEITAIPFKPAQKEKER